MAIRADIPGMGVRYFPEGTSEDEIYARIDEEKARLASARETATGGMSGFGMQPSMGGSSARKEILDTIAGTESPDYNTLYGGRKISDLSWHPGIDVPITSGPNKGKTSSAFGRYQFLEDTWNEQARQLGLRDMSPASQDAAAWNLASQTYRRKTGGDLEADWASGDPAARRQALSALSSVWTSLPGGIEQAARYGRRGPSAEDAQQSMAAYRFDPRNQTTGDILKGGFARGYEGLKGTAFDLIPALGASIFGKDEYAREQLAEYGKRMEDVEQEYPTAFKSYKDVEGIGHAFDFAFETVGENGADIAAFLLGAGAGSSLLKRGALKSFEGQLEKHLASDRFKDYTEAQKDALIDRYTNIALQGARQKAGQLGSTIGTGLVSEAINVPETFQQVYEDTGKLEPGIALGMGSLSAALDTIVPKQIFDQLTGAQRQAFKAALVNKSEVVPQSFKKAFLAETGKIMAEEGLTEGTQEAINNLASNFAGANKDIMEGVLNASIKGAIGGTAFGAPGAALEAYGRKGAAQEEIDRREERRLQADFRRQQAEQMELDRVQQAEQARRQRIADISAAGPEAQLDMFPEELEAERRYSEALPRLPQLPPIENERRARAEAGMQLEAERQAPRQMELPGEFSPYEFTGDKAPVTREGEALMTPRQRAAYEAQIAATEEQRKQDLLRRQGTVYPPGHPLEGYAQQQGEPTQLDMFPAEKAAAEGAARRGVAPYAEPAAGSAPAEPQFSPVVTPELLKSVGLTPQSGFYKQLVGKDITNPEDRKVIEDVIGKVQKNPKLAQSTKDGVRSLYTQAMAMYGKQGDMFPYVQSPEGGAGARVPFRNVGGGAGVSAQVPSGPGVGVPAGGAGVPPATGMEGAEPVAIGPERGAAAQPGALKKGAPKKAPTAKKVVVPIVPKESQDLGEQRNAIRGRARSAYSAGDLTPGQYAFITNLLSKGEIEPVQKILDELDNLDNQANQLNISEEGRKKLKARGKVNINNLMQLIGAQMYSSNLADVTIKEMVQNSFDAVKASLAKGLEKEGKIDVMVDPGQRLIMIRDNGQGMTPKVIRDAFLTIAGTSKEGLDSGDASGGFGMAKAAFLLGNERIWVRTSKNGTRTTFEANGSEIFSKDIDMLQESVPKDEHGTTIVVKVPKTVPSESGEREVWFPYDASAVEFFNKPMLNPNIEVNFAHMGYSFNADPESLLDPSSEESERVDSKLEPVSLAKNFDLSGYHKEATANFDWGSADIYIGNERVGGRWPSPKHSVLSSGIYQFDMNLAKNYERVPYNIIIDVKPTAAPTSAIYPFNIKREGWKDQIKEDVKALENYLHNIFAGKGASETVETFKNIESLPRVDTDLSAGSGKTDVSEFIVRKPQPKPTATKVGKAKEEATETPKNIDISNGTVTVTGRKGEKYGSSFTADKPMAKAEDFLLDLGIDHNLPIYHNNTNVDYSSMHPDAPAFFAEIGSVFMDMRDKIASINEGSYKYQPLEEPFFTGISVDKDYHGVNIVIPFKGVMLNPLAVKGTKLPSIVLGLYDTMVHEFAHVPQRSHDANFVSEFHDLNSRLAEDGFDLETRDKLTNILRKHKDLFNDLRYEYEKSTTRNIAKSIHETEESGGTASGVGSGTPSGGKRSAEYEQGPLYERREQDSRTGVQRNVAGGRGREQRGRATAFGTEALALEPLLPPNLSAPDGPFKVASAMGRLAKKIPFFNSSRGAALAGALDQANRSVRSAALSLVPGVALSDMASRYFPKGMAEMYHKLITQHDGFIHTHASNVIEPITNIFRRAMKLHRQQQPLFDKLTDLSTKEQVDPTDANSIIRATQFSMGYLKFDANGNQIGREIKYFDTAVERDQAIRAHNTGKPKYERAFRVRDADVGTREKAREIMAMWNQLKPEWKNLYRTIKNANVKTYDLLRQTLSDRIDTHDLDADAKILLKKDIFTRLAEAGMITPYFSLTREGDHWLSAEVPNQHGVYENITTAFTDPLSREKFQTNLKNMVYQFERRKGTSHEEAMDVANQRVRSYSRIDEIDYRNMPSSAAINSIFKIIDTKRPRQTEGESDADYRARMEQYDNIEKDIMQMVIKAMPETSILKSLKPRENTPGNKLDTMGSFERKQRSMVRQIANLKYRPMVRDNLDGMAQYADILGRGQDEVRDPATGQLLQSKILPQDNDMQVQYLNAFKKHAGYFLNPTPQDLAGITKSLIFGGTMAFNPSSAIIEYSNVPMIVYPYMAAEYGANATRAALNRAVKVFTKSGDNRTVTPWGSEEDPEVRDEKLKAGWSMGNYAKNSREYAYFGPLIEAAASSGMLNRSQLYENLLSSSRTGLMDKWNAAAGWMLHRTSAFNREVTMMAAYSLEFEKLKKQRVPVQEAAERAANKAIYTAEITNGSVAAADAPRFAHNSLGSIVMMYKRFGITNMYMQMKMVREAYGKPPERLPGESQAEYAAKVRQFRQEAEIMKRRFAGLQLSTALFSGLHGLPLYGAAAAMFNLFRDDDEDDADTVTQKAIGDLFFNGPLEYYSGVSIASRIGLSGLIFKEPRSGGETSSFSEMMMDSVGGPLPGMVDRLENGVNMINNGNVWRGMEAMMPASLANLMKAARYMRTGRAETLRGDPIYNDVGAMDAAITVLGFAPVEVRKRQEFNAKQMGLAKAEAAKDSNIKGRYYKAYREHDRLGMQEAKEMLLEFGQKHPHLKYTPSTINEVLRRSVKKHDEDTKKMIMGKSYSKAFRPVVREAMEDLGIEEE